MTDITDNMEDDFDLLSILESSSNDEKEESKTDVEEALERTQEEQDKIDADKKMSELKEIANSLTKNVSGTQGSGDIDVDLNNWFDGKDSIPSEPLNNYISNSGIKMDYGLARNTLTSYNLMSKLRKFIEEDAFDALFSESAVLGMEPEDVLDRVKVAFTMYKELASLNQRTIMSLKDYKLKSSDSDEVDKLTLLLSSIPSSKLEEVLRDISKG